MKIFVGTSGWMYDWNPNGFEWYVKYSGLNAIELNMSFYRFPYPNQVKGWYRRSKDKGLRWAVKVHRLITHTYLLSEKSYSLWERFIDIFKPLDNSIDFYLLQLPPRFRPTPKLVEKLEKFIDYVNLGWRLAIEWRSTEWFNEEWVKFAREKKFTVVSVDAPEFRFYACSGPYVYLRMHGRTFWYVHYYTNEELVEVAEKISKLKADTIYVFFNNNHDMLENAQRMLRILSEVTGRKHGGLFEETHTSSLNNCWK